MVKKIVPEAALSVIERELRKQAKDYEQKGEAGDATARVLRRVLDGLDRVRALAEPWPVRAVWVFSTDDDAGANVSVHTSLEAAEAAARVWLREKWDEAFHGRLPDVQEALRVLAEGGTYGRIERCVPLGLAASRKAGGPTVRVNGGGGRS